jgi:hypothetical protein
VGDSLSLGGALITDSGANPASTAAFSALSGSFTTSTPPAPSSLVTADTDADGFIDRLILTFDRPMNEATLSPALFSLSSGSISGVTDDGGAGNPIIWVNLTDGILGTGAEPRLSIQAGAIRDTGGTPNAQVSAFPSTDGAAPRLMYTLAVVGERSVFVRFSEPVNHSGAPLGPADFSYSDAANPILYVVAADPIGGYADGVFLSLTNPLTDAAVLAPQNLTLAASTATDRKGLSVPGTVHCVSDLLLGAVQPVWAAAAQGGATARSFNGSETLDHQDLTVQALTLYPTVPAPSIYFDSNVAQKSNGLWLPVAIPGLVATANTGAQGPQAAFDVQGNLYSYLLTESNLQRGSLDLVLEVGGRYCLRVLNPKDPRSLAMWSLKVQDSQPQRGSVTILDNVLRPARGGKTTLVYSLDRRGSVTILVSDMRGDIVAVLVRTVQDAGQHAASWDGRNRAGRIVAPGLYYVKIVGPGINEVRKVLVGK